MEDRYQVECCEGTHVHQATVEEVRSQIPDEDVLYDLARKLFSLRADGVRENPPWPE